MYRYLHIFLVAIFLLPGFNNGLFAKATSANAVISIADVEASPGEVVDVPVTASGFQDVYLLQFRMAYNSDVLSGVSIENLHSSISNATTNPNSNPIYVGWYSFMNGLNLPNDTKLFDLRFTFCEDADECAIHNFFAEVSFVESESYIEGPPPVFNPIPVTLENGSVFDPEADFSTLTINISGEGLVMVNGEAYTGPYVTATGSTLALEAHPDLNWEFENWSGDLSGTNPVQSITMDEDKEVTANFSATEPEEYTIVATAGPGGDISPEGSIPVLEGDNQKFEIEADNGYHIDEVLVDDQSVGALSSYLFENVSQDHSIHALFAINTYQITTQAQPEDGGTTSGDGQYDHGEEVNLDATANTGYTFQHWQEDNQVVSTEETLVFTATEDRDLIAHFELKSYTISATANPEDGGSIAGAGTYDHGEQVSLQAMPAEGYEFINWTENGSEVSTEETYAFTATENRDLVAHFELFDYTLTVNVEPLDGGTVSISPDQEFYHAGDQVTLTAAAAEGCSLNSWLEGDESIGQDTVLDFTMPAADVTLTALFSINTYQITAEAYPADGGTITGDGEYAHNHPVTLLATPDEGYSFLHWLEEEDTVAFHQVYHFTAEKDRHLVAAFELNTYQINATVTPAGSGSVTGQGTYEHGQEAVLSATPNEGYLFDGWTENGTVVSNEENYTFIVNGNRTLVANFQQTAFEVTFHADLSNAIHHGLLSGFEPDLHHIYISGDMNDWAVPGVGDSDQLMEKISDDPLVYAITFTLPEGTYNYKYFSDLLGDGWDGAEWDGAPDRKLHVTGHTDVNDMFGPDDLSSAAPDASVTKVYPNPARHQFYVHSKSKIKRVQMVALSGQQVYDAMPGSKTHRIQAQDLRPGLYLVRLHTSQGMETHKIQISP